MSEPVVLFDGVCNFCNGAVQFIVDHERDRTLRFASLQSDVAKDLLANAGLAPPEGDPETIVLVEGDRALTHSSAALAIARRLRAPWSWLAVLVLVPRPVRDFFYRWFARNRYRWFGKTDQCRVPTPELRARFLA